MPFRLTASLFRGYRRLRRRRESERERQQRAATAANDRAIRNRFEEIVNDAERNLQGTVPVLTGKMKRRTAARGDNRGSFRTVSIYSDATNSNNREYAKYVKRYARALRSTLSRTEARINTSVVRIIEYRFRGFVFSRKITYVRASRFMSANIAGTHLVLRLQIPSGDLT